MEWEDLDEALEKLYTRGWSIKSMVYDQMSSLVATYMEREHTEY
jgi:hypothetical protein